MVLTGNSANIVKFLLKAGVDDPVNCSCSYSDLEKDANCLYWHQNHRSCNRAFWEMIPRDRFEELRALLQNDFDGNIVPKSFAKKLLKNFLIANGMQVNWI